MKAWLFAIAFALVFLAGSAFATGSISVSLNSLNAIAVGESATVTATVAASGDNASAAQVAISLPSGLTTSDSTTQSIGTISAGSSSTKSWSVYGNSEGTYTITVTASATGVTSQTANATLVVSNSALVQTTTITAPASSLAAGGTTTFAVQYSNNGGVSATVNYSLSYGSGLTLSSGASSGSFDLNAGGSTTRSWTVSMSGTGNQTVTLATTTSNTVPNISYTIAGPSTGTSPGGTTLTCTSPQVYNAQTKSCVTPSTTTKTPSTPTTPETPANTSTVPEAGSQIETIMPVTKIRSPEITSTAVQAILESAGITGTSPEKIMALSQSMPITKSLEVKKITNADGNVSYSSTISISVKNLGKQPALNVKIVEEIPKAIAQKAAEISSAISFSVLKDDPILQFQVSRINPGESATVKYTVPKQLDLNAVNNMTPAMVVDRLLEEEKAPSGKEKITAPLGGKGKPELPGSSWAIPGAIMAIIVIALVCLYIKRREPKAKRANHS